MGNRKSMFAIAMSVGVDPDADRHGVRSRSNGMAGLSL
jgi:hypothetical protein